MTKRDYELVAAAIAETRRETWENETLDNLIEKLCPRFVIDNPRFDGRKFMAACSR